MVSDENGGAGNGGVNPIDEDGYILFSFAPPNKIKGTIRRESFPDPVNKPNNKLVEVEFVGFDGMQPNNSILGPTARLYFEIDTQTRKIISGSISGSVTGPSIVRTYSFNRTLSLIDFPSSNFYQFGNTFISYQFGTRITTVWSQTTTSGLINIGVDQLWELEYLSYTNGSFDVLIYLMHATQT